MSTLTKAETSRVERFVQDLLAFQKRTDERTYAGPGDFQMRQIDGPSGQLIAEAERLLRLLAGRNIATPLLGDFFIDRSPFEVTKVIQELRAVEEHYGEE